MNDALYEQLVPRKQKTSGILISILIIVLVSRCCCFRNASGRFSVISYRSLILMIAFYFIFPKLNVEYEYMILNHDLQIDAIYNKSKRKHMLSFDIQSAEIIAPKKSPRLNAFHPDKTYDFTSGNENADVYAL